MHDALSSIEAEAERMYASERGLMDADSQSRDRLYQRAQQVNTPLAQQHICRLAYLMLFDRLGAGLHGLYSVVLGCWTCWVCVLYPCLTARVQMASQA